MIDFSTLQGLTIPEGVVTQIAKDGVVLWALNSGGGDTVILEVEKYTSDTYAGSTTYTGEQFVLLDIYPKTNGTVSVTYGGLTKTITDTSGAESPNAQQVFFGTFNGVSDSVTTPTSGTLTIEGDYYAFGCGSFKKMSNKVTTSYYCPCITDVTDIGKVSIIPADAFYDCQLIKSITIPNGVTAVNALSFYRCVGLTYVFIPKSVELIQGRAFSAVDIKNPITVDTKNPKYIIDGNCLIDVENSTVIEGFLDSVIPSYVNIIGAMSFMDRASLENIVIPSNVKEIGGGALSGCSSLTSVTFENTSGWYVKYTDGTITEVDVSNPTENATLFKETYSGILYSWHRN